MAFSLIGMEDAMQIVALILTCLASTLQEE